VNALLTGDEFMAGSNLNPVLRHIRHLIGDGTGDRTDGELLDRFVATRDEDAFTQLVRRHGGLVLGVCRRVLGDAHAAEDVFQATFLVLVRKAAALDRRRPLGNWLYTVAYRLALTARANALRRRTRESQVASARPETKPAERDHDLCVVLDEELHRLPERHRAPLVLCYLEGKTNEQAAQALGWPRGSISRRLAEARDLLRERLVGRGYAYSAAGFGTLVATTAGSAAVPLPLLDATVRAGLWFAAEGAASAAVLSTEAVTLAKGVLHTMAIQKLKIAAAVVLVAGMLGGGGTFFLQSVVGAPAGDTPVAAAEKDRSADAPPVLTPRLGSTQLRHGDTILFLAYTRDARWLVTASKDQTIRLWDLARGAELRRFERPEPPKDKGGGKLPIKLAGGDGMPAMGSYFAEQARQFRVTLSPDGKHLAATRGNAVHVWDVESGKLMHTFQEEGPAVEGLPGQGIVDLTFTQDGKSLITATAGRAITEWDLATGKRNPRVGHEAAAPAGNGARVTIVGAGSGMALSPGGRYLAWEHYDLPTQGATLKVLDVCTGKDIGEAKLGVEGARALTFAPDGKTVAWTSFQEGVQLWDPTAGKEPRQLAAGQRGGPEVESLAFSPDAKTLAASRSDRTVQLWDVAEGKMIGQVGETPDRPEPGARVVVRMKGGAVAGTPVEVAFAPDGKSFAASLGGVAVRRYDSVNGKEIAATGQGHTAPVAALQPSADGRTLVTYARGDAVRVWDLARGQEVGQIPLPANAGNVVLSADGRQVAAGTGTSVTFWDVATGQQAGKIDTGDQAVTALALSPDGKSVATRGPMGAEVLVWDRAAGRKLQTLTGTAPENAENRAGAVVTSVAGVLSSDLLYSPDGRYLVGSGPKRQLCLWDVASGQTVWELELEGNQTVDRITFAHNGLALVTANRDGTVAVYETATGGRRCQLGRPASATPPATMAVMVGNSAMMLGTSERSAPSPLVVASAPGSRFVATSHHEPVIHLWDLLTGQEVGRLEGHQGGITALAFSADGSRLISGSLDTTAQVWDVSQKLRASAANSMGLESKELDTLWADLANKAAAPAFAAEQRLSTHPSQAAALAKARLKPVAGADPAAIARLIENLDSRDFATRQKATSELEQLGEQVRPALEKVLAGDVSLEVRQRVERLLKKMVGQGGGESLRELRVVEMLELAASPEAKQALQTLAAGAPDARLTREARAALKRLEVRPRP
jgi:RNA polymerase sigma factor (sigma-70 family)